MPDSKARVSQLQRLGRYSVSSLGLYIPHLRRGHSFLKLLGDPTYLHLLAHGSSSQSLEGCIRSEGKGSIQAYQKGDNCWLIESKQVFFFFCRSLSGSVSGHTE